MAAIQTPTASYTGLRLTVAAASLVGIPGVQIYVSNLDVKLNKATVAGPIDWSLLTIDGGGSFGFDLSTATDLSVEGTVGLDVGNGFVAAAGTFSFERDVVSGGGLSHATALKLTVSSGSIWVGVGGGLNATHTAVVAGTAGITASGHQPHARRDHERRDGIHRRPAPGRLRFARPAFPASPPTSRTSASR